ncbi:MAG: hypothetical protein CME63_08340 [Halobacteriovoraceae bacterium]|nr:hypothetical protein [Halobacteriovoraceae bacterium]|tara:strand:+ start:11136 stop:11717 length:582 start_codon:yes stop_codon:yes gene_type:complete
MKTPHALITAAALLTIPSVFAQNMIRENLNIPTWAENTELKVGYVYENLDIDGIRDVDNHGIAIEGNKSFNLENGWVTTSAAIFKTSDSEDDFSEIDNTSIGFTQRITKPYEMSQMVLYPILGLGVSYGELEYGEFDSFDQEYVSANAEATLKLDTLRGVAPYLSYTYQIANLEDTERDMNVHAVSGGVSFVF